MEVMGESHMGEEPLSGAGCTLFVGNLSWATTNEELSEFMANYGTVASCQVQAHADTGRSKGWALVTYTTAEECTYTIQQTNGQEFNGRNLNVRQDRSQMEELSGFPVFVGNLPWSTTSEDLSDLFRDFGPFDVHVKTTMAGRSRGFAILRFESLEVAQQATAAMNGHELEGRSIEVREDRQTGGQVPNNSGGARGGRKNQSSNENGQQGVGEEEELPPSMTLFVTNLDWKSTDDDLFQHFSQAGSTPISATVQKNESTHRSKGWGLVTYNTTDEADAARIQLNSTDLDSRKIRIRFDKGR